MKLNHHYGRVKQSKLVQAIKRLTRIRIVIDVPALPEGRENNYYNINNKRQGTLCLLFLWKGKNMKIIEPKIEIEKVDYNKIMKNLERACRTCYRSEDKITEDSYKNFTEKLHK